MFLPVQKHISSTNIFSLPVQKYFSSTKIFPVFQFEGKKGLGTNILQLIARFIGAHVKEDGGKSGSSVVLLVDSTVDETRKTSIPHFGQYL